MTEARQGTVADEAARLLQALQATASSWHAESAAAQDGVTACQVCPLCKLIAAVQRLRPETVQHLADVAGSLTAALADIVAGPPTATSPATMRGHGEQRVDVQRIDITD